MLPLILKLGITTEEEEDTKEGPWLRTTALLFACIFRLCYEAFSLLSKRSIRLWRFLWAFS
jgi:hypothetical protein